MSNYKLYQWVPDPSGIHAPEETPYEIDFKTGLTQRLHPKLTITAGELVLIERYSTATPQPDGTVLHSDLVLKEEMTYTRDAGGFALYRTHNITWMKEDETWGNTKSMTKFYTPQESIQEGIRRRSNIIDDLKMNTIGMIAATETAGDTVAATALGVAFLDTVQVQLWEFRELAHKQPLIDAITNDTSTWLNNVVGPSTTIRDVVLSTLNY